MTRRALFVVLGGLTALLVFASASFFYNQRSQQQASNQAVAQESNLVRPHSPSLGPEQARVTVVEFLDPACEACRAFYPYVKQTLAAFPNDVRLVIRYVPFHKDISVVGVQILEAARAQGVFEPVLEALLRFQPEWAGHDSPAATRAWELAGVAGLDVVEARRHASTGAAVRLLELDMVDVKAVDIRATPSFFVNGKPLPSPDPRLLHEMVTREVESLTGMK